MQCTVVVEEVDYYIMHVNIKINVQYMCCSASVTDWGLVVFH